MKTIHQKRVEALERRMDNLKTLELLRQRVNDALSSGAKLSQVYEPWSILVNDDNREEFVDDPYVCADATDRDDMDRWFSRKIAHATRDIESLEKILGGSHG